MRLTRISNIKIDQICQALEIPLQGVLMKDQFSITSPNGIYIVNLNDSNQSGSHWTLLIKMKNNKYLYFDSFGAPPPQTILDTLKIDPNKLQYNDQQIQDIKSQTCGYFAILFAYYYSREKTPNKTIIAFLTNFTTDEKQNDKVLRKIFDKLL